MVENLFERKDFIGKLAKLDKLKDNQPIIGNNERAQIPTVSKTSKEVEAKRIEIKKKVIEDYKAAIQKMTKVLAEANSRITQEEEKQKKLDNELTELCENFQQVNYFPFIFIQYALISDEWNENDDAKVYMEDKECERYVQPTPFK